MWQKASFYIKQSRVRATPLQQEILAAPFTAIILMNKFPLVLAFDRVSVRGLASLLILRNVIKDIDFTRDASQTPGL